MPTGASAAAVAATKKKAAAPKTQGAYSYGKGSQGGTPYTQYSSGVRVGQAYKPASTAPMGPATPPNHFRTLLDEYLAANAQPANTPGEQNPLAIPGSQTGGGRGGGGGGGGGPNPAQVRAAADQTFQFNAQPYDFMRQQVGNQRTQAQGYNPDFAGMEAGFNQRQQAIDQARADAVSRRLQELTGFGQQLAGQQTGAMQGALRDLSAQGVAPGQYLNQANQIAGDRTAMLANQGQYMGQLNASAANQSADYGRAAGLIRQGGEATLANNRGTLMNSLAQQEAQIGLQQAQAQQANDQARREFMLKYGVL